MTQYPIRLVAGDTLSVRVQGVDFSMAAREALTLNNESELLDYMSGYKFPYTTKPGEWLELLGGCAVIGVSKTFDTYQDMAFWVACAEGIPEIGLVEPDVV